MGSGILALSTRAMFASQAKLDTISNNISNANTEGYSRQDVAFATEGGRYTGAGFFGRGVKVQTVTRVSDEFLTRDANANLSISSADATRLDKLQQLEKLFPTGESGIGYSAGQMMNGFVDVANQPQDLSARQVVLARAEDLASRVRSTGAQLTELQAGVLADMQTTVREINTIAARIADVNQKIASVKGVGHEPNDLLDQRDLLVKNLSEKVQISTVMADDATMSVFIGGGQQLVLSSFSEKLSIAKDEYDASFGRLRISDPSGSHPIDKTAITGGSLAGLVKVQDEDIVNARNQIGQMAAALSWRVNQQQSLGLNLGSPATSGAAIFDVGNPLVLPSRFNSSSLSSPPVALTMVDAREAQASDYTLKEDTTTPGNYILTRQSDGETFDVADGSQVDGIRINITGPFGAGDSFVLRPVANAAVSMKRILDRPTGLAAASPVTATVSQANKGTATVGTLNVVSPATTPYALANIVFTNSTGDYELRDSSDAVITTGTWQAGSPIAYNGWELSLNGVPSTGDKLAVSPTLYPNASNGNALTMLSIRDEDIVGRQNLGASGTTPGTTISGAYSQVIGNVGVVVQGAQSAADISSTLASNSTQLLQNKTGVNMDEEAAQLIQYQQNYQAAAKVLQVAQSLFDTLLQIAN